MMHTIITIFYQSITDVTTSTSTTAPTTTAKPGTFIIIHFTDHILYLVKIRSIQYLHLIYPLYDTLDVWYVHGNKGSRTCHIGSAITTTQECQIACRGLNKKALPGRDGNPCYIAVNGKCKQDGRYSRKNYPVCKTLGISIIYA